MADAIMRQPRRTPAGAGRGANIRMSCPPLARFSVDGRAFTGPLTFSIRSNSTLSSWLPTRSTLLM